MIITPKLSALPAAQQALWPELKQIPGSFVLYGGTALALRFGHRVSVDFDFFAEAPIAPDELIRSVPLLRNATIRQSALNTLTVEINIAGPVKLSLFGLTIGRVQDPDVTDDGVLRIASALDVAACKMAAIQTRAVAKDYLDIHELIGRGVKIEDALGAAQAIYGDQFNPMVSIKALASFIDGDLPSMPEKLRNELCAAAGAVRKTTEFRRLPGGLVSGAAGNITK